MTIHMFISGLWQMVARNIAYHLPHRIVYFATIRLWAKATTGIYGHTVVSDLAIDEAMRRWEIRP